MRLIDADVFKEIVGNETKLRKTICEVIDKQPTAYKVENVVEQLKEMSEIYCKEYQEKEGSLYLKDAIEIVRKGGVDHE